MIRHLCRHLSLASFAALLCASVSQAAVWTSTNQWGSWSNGGYTIYNNEWNATHGWQTIWANSYSNWGVASNQPNGAVRSYPESVRTINKTISNYNGVGTWNFTVPGNSGNYFNVSFDCWVPSEVMVWVYTTPGIHPIGSLQVSNVSLAGHQWNVWHGGNNVTTFVRTTNSTSGSVNLRTLIDYGRTKSWYGNGTISSICFGFEIDGTSNTTQNFTMNSMSIGG